MRKNEQIFLTEESQIINAEIREKYKITITTPE